MGSFLVWEISFGFANQLFFEKKMSFLIDLFEALQNDPFFKQIFWP